ncbi:MAG: hypothetical protein KBB94_09245 [Legionellaceae bacterium]|nr:hypothetical protein [Legionellaceae bacterium]MBP9774579.1 hypothetical protein [Legionellaceae bacterium]
MKKILLVCFLLCSSPLLAYDDQAIIKITNATDADCVLTKKTLLYGQISEGSQLPDVIFRDQTLEFSMRSDAQLRFGVRKDKMLLLTYHCADNQEATLFTSISPFQDSFVTSPEMRTAVSSQKNMQAKAEHITTFPLQVHWTLKKPE